MSVKEDIKNQLTALLDERGSLLGLLDKLEPARILAFGTAYQAWYTRAVTLVRSLAPDRLDEFIGYYRVDPKHKTVHAGTYVIQDYINGYGPPRSHRREALRRKESHRPSLAQSVTNSGIHPISNRQRHHGCTGCAAGRIGG